MSQKNAFSRFASRIAAATGRPIMFSAACAVIAGWIALGPVFDFSDTWQLAINTATTIVTFLMVFLIQNTQNRDAHAIQIKLDEIIRAMPGAHNVLLDLEELSEADLERIRTRYIELAILARAAVARGAKDTDEPEITLGEAIAENLSNRSAL